MALENFIPTVESASLLKELEKHLLLAENTNRKYEGDVRQKGDSVRILCVNKPTIYDIDEKQNYALNGVVNGSVAGTGREVIHKGIGDAEELETSSITMQINKIAYYHYTVGDIDYEQMEHKEVWEQRRADAAKGVAEVMDKYIAGVMAKDSGAQVDMTGYTAGTTKIVGGDASTGEINVLDFIDNLVQILNDREIRDTTELVMEVSPKFWKVLKKAYRDLDTNNSVLLKGRTLGVYNDVKILKTTSCYKADGTNEFVFIHTKDAVAFVAPLTKVEAYRPEKGFADAVKGFALYDAKVIRPNEIISAKVTY